MNSPLRIQIYLLILALFVSNAGRAQSTDAPLIAKIDSTFNKLLGEKNVPGAIFAMVHGDSIVMLRGYGVAHVDKATPVDPTKTIFRVASVSKGVSAIGVMQMVDKGLIDLNEPVNKYLKNFRLPDQLGTTTMAHLMTHSSGYDQRGSDRRTLDPSKMVPMVKYFPSAMPDQVLPPGKILSYSTWIGSIAGYTTEEISGVPFNDWMKTNVFQPMEMNRTGFVLEDLPTEDVAQGYFFVNDNYREAPFEYTKTVPGTMMMTTASDMANLLLMLVNNGKFKDKTILSEESIAKMKTIQLTPDKRMLGATFGMYDMWANGRRILTHSGGFDGFMAQYYLLPEHQTAFFMAFNQRNGGAEVNSAVRDVILDYLMPEEKTVTKPEDIIKLSLDRFVGRYQNTSMAISNIDKLDSFGGRADWKITKGRGDTLMMFGESYVPIEPLLFRWTGGPNEYAKFYEDEQGNITEVTFGGLLSSHRKLKWYEEPLYYESWMGISLLTFTTVLVMSVVSVIRKNKIALPWKVLTSISLLYVVSAAIAMAGPTPNRYGIPMSFKAGLLLMLVSAAASTSLIYFVYAAWRGDGTKNKILFTFCSLVTMLFALWLNQWNMLGFQY